MTCLYDEAIAFVDHELGRLMARLVPLGLADRTVIVLTADHGEAFFEHGTPLHTTLYDDTTRVPLIVSGPGIARGHRVVEPVSGVDVAATILDLAGVRVDAATAGRSLAPGLRGKPLVTTPPLVVGRAEHAVALRRGTLKYLLGGAFGRPGESGVGAAEALYDLDLDPGERRNLAGSTAFLPVLESMRGAVAAEEDAGRQLWARHHRRETESFRTSPEDERRLRALGYLE